MRSVKRWPTSCAVYVPNDGQEPGRKGSRVRGERTPTERGNRAAESIQMVLRLRSRISTSNAQQKLE